MPMKFGLDYDVIPAFAPLDLQTARVGDWASLKNAHGVTIIFYKGVGTAGDDPTLTVEQAKDVAGTGAKNLAVVTEHWRKQAATDLTGSGTWTRATQAASQDVAYDATSAEEALIDIIHIDADELDVDNGFDCVRAKIADVGVNAQLGTILYILEGLRYPATPANLPNAIVD